MSVIRNPQSPIRNAFTLIELIVVLMALAIVAAAVVPAMRGAGGQQDLENVTARVVASARYARQAAQERQEIVALTVEVEPPLVRLVVEEEEDAQPVFGQRDEPVQFAPLPAAFALVRLPSRVTAYLEPAPEDPQSPAASLDAVLADGLLRFHPDGRTHGGVVVLTDHRGRERRVLITPDTGAVRIEADYGGQ